MFGHGDGREGRLEEGVGGNFDGLTRVRVDQVHEGRDFLHDANLRDSPERSGQLGRQTHDVVLANRHDLNAERVLVVEDVARHVVTDELLGVLVANRNYRLQKVDEFFRVGFRAEEEIESL